MKLSIAMSRVSTEPAAAESVDAFLEDVADFRMSLNPYLEN